MSRSLLFEGYFGMGNAGDDAFCAVATSLLAPALNLTDVAFVSRPSALPSLPFSLPSPARSVLPEQSRFPGHSRLMTLGSKSRVDAVIHLGGSTLRKMNRRRRDEQLLAAARLVRQHAVCVSVGPFRSQTDAQDIAAFLRRFRSISTRDSASLVRVRDLGLHVPIVRSFDLAVLLPEAVGLLPQKGDAHSRRLGIALRPFESVEGGDQAMEHHRETAVLETLRSVAANTGATFRFLALNKHRVRGDVALADRLAARLQSVTRTEVFRYDGELSPLLHAVAGCDTVLAMRLHAAIFAYSLNIPFALIDYHPKCGEFASEVGLPSELVLRSGGPELGLHDHMLTKMLQTGGPIATLAVGEACTRARGSFDHVRAYL